MEEEEPGRGKRKSGVGNHAAMVGASGTAKETLHKALAWIEDERGAGKKVSVRAAADKFGVSKTTLHRFLGRHQHLIVDMEKNDAKDAEGSDWRKLDKLGIQFLLGNENNLERGNQSVPIEDTEAVLSTSSATAEAKRLRKRPLERSKDEGVAQDQPRAAESEGPPTSPRQESRLMNLDRQICTLRSTIAILNRRVEKLEHENSQRGMSSRKEFAASSG